MAYTCVLIAKYFVRRLNGGRGFRDKKKCDKSMSYIREADIYQVECLYSAVLTCINYESVRW